MAVAVQALTGALAPDERRAAISTGTLLIFTGVEAMTAFVSFVDVLAREHLGSEPVRAQFTMSPAAYLRRVTALQREFRTDPRRGPLLRDALQEVGVDPESTFWDRPYLRVAPHGDGHEDRQTQRLGFHRDTWASNVYTQTNWWAPVYPITAGRTIAFYPQYWRRPVRNTSADWDLEVVMAGRSSDVTPMPTEPVDTGAELRVVIEPGDLLCFSGAHLHASVPNSTGAARISVEVRTADATHSAKGRAPNLDGAAPHVAARWFRHMQDDRHMPVE